MFSVDKKCEGNTHTDGRYVERPVEAITGLVGVGRGVFPRVVLI